MTSIARSFTNELGQTVLLPDLFRVSKYLDAIKLIAATQVGLDALDLTVNGNTFTPRLRGVLPALTKIIFEVLETNRGRSENGLRVMISARDVANMLDLLSANPLYRYTSLVAAFHNVVNKIRDDMNRQIGLPTHRALLTKGIRHNVPTRGRAPEYYWFA